MRKEILPLVALLVMLSLLVTACVVPATPELAVKEGPTEVSEAEKEVSGPTYGGTLRIGLDSDVPGLLPGVRGGWTAFVIVDGIYDSLLEYDNEFNLQPGLAESWDVEDEGKTIVLHLRKGVQFHDGTPFNAEAVKFHLDRFINPTGEVIWNLTDVIESVEVVDDYTVTIHLYAPNVAFLYNLAQDPGQIPSKTAVEEKGDSWVLSHPVGTGPFMFEKWEPGVEVDLVRNPNYWRTDEQGNQLPYLDGVEWEVLPDETARTIALRTGDIDIETFVPAKDYESLQAAEDVELWVQNGGTNFIEFNTTDPPFNVKENRLAVRNAVDYEAIRNAVFYGLSDLPQGPPVPTGMWSHDPSRPVLERDLEKAKELLAQAGNPEGFTVDLASYNDAISKQIDQVIQANLAEVGIKVNIVTNEFARWIEILQKDRHAVQMALPGFGRMRPNAEEYYNADWVCQGSQAFSNWCNEGFDSLIFQSEQTLEREGRLALLHQAEQIYMDDCPGFAVAYNPFIHATNKRVQNYSIHPAGELNWRWLWLKP